MASIILLLIFIAFYTLYNTSKKAVLNTSFGYENWIAKKSKTGKLLGASSLVISCFISCICFGFGVGIFLFFIALMTLGSLTIILNPLKLIKPIPTLTIFVLSISFEFLILN